MNMNTKAEAAMLSCSNCSAQIDVCYFCDEGDCPKAVCYTCISIALGQMERQPHDHGG
jgi:hypothetical protein